MEGCVPGLAPWPVDGHLLPVSFHVASHLCMSIDGCKFPLFVKTLVVCTRTHHDLI